MPMETKPAPLFGRPRFTRLCFPLALVLGACGSPGDDASNPGGNAGSGPIPAGEAGGAPAAPSVEGGGGNATIGGSPGGTVEPAGGTGGGTEPNEAACMPHEGANLGPFCELMTPDPEDLGIPDDPSYISIDSSELIVPITAGDPYAYSFRYDGGAFTLELWGSTPHSNPDFTCGMATELLVSKEIPGNGSYCVDFVATQDHTHWLHVTRGGRGGGLHTEINYCPAATCP